MIAYHRPTGLEDALALRANYAREGRELKLLAGATDVIPARTTRAGWGETRHPDVLDLTAVKSLAGIGTGKIGWRIGALATWTDVIRAELPPAFDGLKQAAREVGGIQIQNRGTLVGNVCNASPAADGVPCLLALEAEIELRSATGLRRIPLSSFLVANRKTALAADEIATALHIPTQSGRGHFLKLGARRYLVISIAMVSGVVAVDAASRVTSARIAIGSCSAVARRQPRLEAAIVGRALQLVPSSDIADALLDGIEPIGDVRASAAYRRAAALELARDLFAHFATDRRSAA